MTNKFVKQTDSEPQHHTWLVAWRAKSYWIQLIYTLALLVLAIIGLSIFLGYVERRPGTILADPLHAMFAARDFTWLIFALIYASLVLGLGALLPDPPRLLVALQAYTLLVIVRIVAMYLLPLEPPPGMIVLSDPMAGIGPGAALTKDLFFSGHTATLFLLMLAARQRMLKYVFLAATVIVAILLLWQKVHYSIDVLAAPFFAYGCFAVVKARGQLYLSD